MIKGTQLIKNQLVGKFIYQKIRIVWTKRVNCGSVSFLLHSKNFLKGNFVRYKYIKIR